MPSSTATRPGDGRTARAERTRTAIVDAHVALMREGVLRPTGEQITERAGVSPRSLWVHFTDLEELFTATAAGILGRQEARLVAVDPGLPLAARVAGFSRQRADGLEDIAPLARASVLREPFSEALRDYHRRHLDLVRAEAATLFAPELAVRPSRSRSLLLDAVVAASTWGTWVTLRDRLGLDVAAARTVLETTVGALLRDVPPAGGTTPDSER